MSSKPRHAARTQEWPALAAGRAPLPLAAAPAAERQGVRRHREGANAQALAGIVGSLLLLAVNLGAETIFLPVVANRLAGVNGAVWDSELRVTGRAGQPVVVERLAFLGTDGLTEFSGDQRLRWQSADSPSFPGIPVIRLSGADLLGGLQREIGAMVIEVSGGRASLRIADRAGRDSGPRFDPAFCCLLGASSEVQTTGAPLSGETEILGHLQGGKWGNDSRMNLIVANFGPEPLLLEVRIFQATEIPERPNESVMTEWPAVWSVEIGAESWNQFCDLPANFGFLSPVGHVFFPGDSSPTSLRITPLSPQPYLAAISVIDNIAGDPSVYVAQEVPPNKALQRTGAPSPSSQK